MDILPLERAFTRIGARVKLADPTERRRWRSFAGFSLDIREDRKGEYFELAVPEDSPLELHAVDIRPLDRHLLLHADQAGQKDKFLCGHDERHWFTCAVPGQGVSSVRAAMQALRPGAVRVAERRVGLRARESARRHNAAFVRQGEWFFLPVSDEEVGRSVIHHNEPISRGRGKPHWCEQVVRKGGGVVYVNRTRNSMVLTEPEYRAWMLGPGKGTAEHWSVQRRNATVYARGKVRHADHATLELRGWHRVLMNTEGEARAARNVVFLD